MTAYSMKITILSIAVANVCSRTSKKLLKIIFLTKKINISVHVPTNFQIESPKNY